MNFENFMLSEKKQMQKDKYMIPVFKLLKMLSLIKIDKDQRQ